jgi:hypothetical protein
MNWIKKKIPKLLIWLFFWIAFAVLPMLILGGMAWFDLDVSQGWLAVKETIAKGDLLLVIAAVVADSIGRLLQDVVTQNPRTYAREGGRNLDSDSSNQFICTGISRFVGF